MRVTKEKAAANRDRILTESARLLRVGGLSGVGVDALAKAAGLTHGSLYSQFGSKDRLITEALKSGFERTESSAAGIDSLEQAVGTYLSDWHKDNPGAGCYMAALGCEIPRQSKAIRKVFTDIVRRSAARLGARLSSRSKRQREDDGLFTIATLVGAMVLARSVDDPELADQIMNASRARLLRSLQPQVT